MVFVEHFGLYFLSCQTPLSLKNKAGILSSPHTRAMGIKWVKDNVSVRQKLY